MLCDTFQVANGCVATGVWPQVWSDTQVHSCTLSFTKRHGARGTAFTRSLSFSPPLHRLMSSSLHAGLSPPLWLPATLSAPQHAAFVCKLWNIHKAPTTHTAQCIWAVNCSVGDPRIRQDKNKDSWRRVAPVITWPLVAHHQGSRLCFFFYFIIYQNINRWIKSIYKL